MVWDHLFGTYTPEDEEPLYGVTVPIGTAHPIKIQAAGLQWFLGRYRRAHGWRERLRAIYKPQSGSQTREATRGNSVDLAQ